MYNFSLKFVEDNLFSLKIKQFLFGPIKLPSIQFGPLGHFQPPSVHFILIGSLIDSFCRLLFQV